MSQRRLSRRALLAAVGASAAGLAGCAAPADPAATTSQSDTTSGADTTTQSTGSDSESGDDLTVSLSGDDRWTTYGYDPGHSGHNPDAAGPRDDPGQAWSAGVDGIYTLREPAVADGRVFVGSDSVVWAFDAETGDQAWQTDVGGMAHHFAPTYRDGTLFAVSKDSSGVNNGATGAVRALAPSDGGVQWRTQLPVTSTVVHDGDRLVVAAKADGTASLQALDPETGDRGWRFDVPDAPESYVTGAPTYADGTVYAAATHVQADGTTSGALYALAADSGELDWQVDVSGALSVAPVVADGRVHVAARDGTVRAVSTDGTDEWTADPGARIYTRPTYADGRLFVLTAADIVAYDDAGEELWRSAGDRSQMTGMAVADGTLYVGGEPLFALAADSGDVVFDLPVGAYHGAYGAPVVVDDVMYAGICIKDEQGAIYDNYVRAWV
ncbi:MAG: PQQ-binding-like beta-propeller repeat protein [Halobacterium sp.]